MNTVIMVIAIIAGPILAVQAQKWVERLRKRKELKEGIFHTLMTTRGTPMDRDRIRALNMIDLAFSINRRKEKKVVHAWRTHHDHLYSAPADRGASDYKTKFDMWNTKNGELFNELLFQMATSLRYSFDKVHLKRGGYTPGGWDIDEIARLYLRDSVVDLFQGKKSFPVRIVESTSAEKTKPSDEDSSKPPKEDNKQENPARKLEPSDSSTTV